MAWNGHYHKTQLGLNSEKWRRKQAVYLMYNFAHSVSKSLWFNAINGLWYTLSGDQCCHKLLEKVIRLPITPLKSNLVTTLITCSFK